MGRADSPLITPNADADAHDPLLTPEDTAPAASAAARKDAAAGLRDDTKEDGARCSKRPQPSSEEMTTSFETKTSSVKKYRKIERVGEGSYGSVYKAENLETKEIVAVKVASKNEDPVWGGFPLSLLREIGILRRLQHENIVQIHEVISSAKGDPLIIMEFCQASLMELLNSRSHDLSLSEVKYVIRQILDATRHMHEQGILHRDLATKNVLFNTSGEIKVCDFGISRLAFADDGDHGFLPAKDLEDPNMIVSLPYRAIELLLGQREYGPALDVWAAGAILGEIILCQGGRRQTFFGGSRENPNKTPQAVVEEVFSLLGKPSGVTWPGHAQLPLWNQMASVKIDKMRAHGEGRDEKILIKKWFVSGGGQMTSWKYSLSDACFNLMGSLLTLNPAKRITAAEALRSGFFVEKPQPVWHSWHWACASTPIPRGEEMRKQRGQEGETETLLRQLSKDEEKRDRTKAKSTKEQAKEALLERVKQKRQMNEEQRQPHSAAGHGSSRAAEDVPLPSGWTKHWSTSKQRYYYHNPRTKQNQWEPPK